MYASNGIGISTTKTGSQDGELTGKHTITDIVNKRFLWKKL